MEAWRKELYLAHHGIKGQKWGVRRYQNLDGSLTPDGKERYSQSNAVLNRLSKTVDSFDYGVIINGKRYNEEEFDKVNWDDYRTMPVEKVGKEKIGTCWDFVNYQHYILDKAGIPNKSYMFVMRHGSNPDDVATHTFTIAQVGDQNKWIESAMWKKRGVHDVKDAAQVANSLADSYGKGSFKLYEFNPDGMDQGLTDKEYFNLATYSKPIHQRQ